VKDREPVDWRYDLVEDVYVIMVNGMFNALVWSFDFG
jgi:hypothetical protein